MREPGKSGWPIASWAEIQPATTRENSHAQVAGLIRQAWHWDPLQDPVGQKVMRWIPVIGDPTVIQRILRHLHLWCDPPRPAATKQIRAEGDLARFLECNNSAGMARIGEVGFAPARPPPSVELREPEPEFFVDSDPMSDFDKVITD